MIAVITLVRNETYLENLKSNIKRYDPEGLTYLHAQRGAKSITSGYNQAVNEVMQLEAIGVVRPISYFLFIHEDARIYFNLKQVLPIWENCGVIGFVGCEKIFMDSRWWLGQCLIGGLFQGGPDNPDPSFKPVRNVVYSHQLRQTNIFPTAHAVDGYAMLIRREVFHAVDGFSEEFDNWHCYDADLCMKCMKAGYVNRVAISTEIVTQHFSGGSLADPWARENAKFIAKWGAFIKGGCKP